MQSITVEELHQFVYRMFRACKLTPRHAEVCATHIVTNERRGIISHGLRRLPNYIARLDAGVINPRARVRVIRRQGATTLLDGQHAMGQVTATHATSTAIRLARRYGIACVGAQRCEHIGALDAYVRTMVEHQLVSIVLCNTPLAMAPIGGTRPLIGSNPIAIGIPGRLSPLMIFDGTTAATSRGKLLMARDAHQPLHAHVAVDANGAPTTDAQAALAGAILPSGVLGYGIGLAIGLMTGGMLGGMADSELPSFFATPFQPTPGSMLILAIDPTAFGGLAQLHAVGESWLTQIRQSHGNPRIPGDLRTIRNEISVPDALAKELAAIATSKGIPRW